ncbi:MAG TPA: type II toxin-antitoxin system VapC family toxin [Cyclobacteriaceae bacterium]|nr:type II toxin-antitoxin system VapC family toxin [Cyclobacteriaceae bacterium]
MTYLLDTHYLIWALADTKKLSKNIKEIIVNPDHKIVISTVSFWEISLKSYLGKLNIIGFLPEDLPEACLEVGFDIECLSAKACSTYHKLKGAYHKDPFDRMLIWQAIQNDYTLISSDRNVIKYASEGLKVAGGQSLWY